MTPIHRSFLLATAALAAAAACPAADVVTVVDTPDTAAVHNAYYPSNRPPLLPSPLIKLPVGAIKPEGWLRKQLELEAAGQ